MRKLIRSDASAPRLGTAPAVPQSCAFQPALRWSVDTGMRIRFMRGPALVLLGLEAAELTGASLPEALPPDERVAPWVAAHGEALRGESLSMEVEWAGRPFLLCLEPVPDEAGRVSGVMGVAWSAEREFAGSKDFTGELTEDSSEATFLLTERWQIMFASPSCFRILGYGQGELTGRSYFELVHPSDLPMTRCVVEEMAEQPGRVEAIDARVRARDGSWRWMRCVSANRLQTPGVRAVVVNAHDISELRRAEIERGVFLEVIDALNTTSNLDELLAQIHGSLQKAIYAENCLVALYNRQTKRFQFPFFVDRRRAAPPPEAGRGCVACVFRKGEPILIGRKALEELQAAGEVEVEVAGTPPCSWLGVPLRTPSATIGVLAVQHYEEEGAYSGRDLELLTSIGGQIALAIERKQAEDTLRREQRDHEIIFHSAPSMIWYKDTENRILRANRAAAHSLGMELEEVEGRSAYDLFPSEAVRYHQDDLEVVRTGQPKLGIIEPYRLPSGEVRTVRTDKIPYRDASRRTIGVVAFSNDITERQRAEEAMRRSELNYRSVVQGAPYGICRVGQDGRLYTVNPAMAEMLGYDSEEELLTTNLDRDVFREPGERKAMLDARGEVLEGVEAGWRRKDGSMIQVRLSGRPVRDPEWPSTCYELIAENVTGQHALEEQLRQAQKMEAVGRLAGGVAHDFNNLLMVIKGQAELLLDGSQGGLDVQKVKQIERAADRAAQLTRQLLAFSRMQILQPKMLDLGEVVADLGKMLPRLIGEDIELEMPAAPGLDSVKADRGQIEQVIMNLAVNARDAMPEGGKLRIHASNADVDDDLARRFPPVVPGRYVLLTVSDTGMGMDAETQARIFEPFFTTKEIGKGTGLGLATVYGVVKQSGGYICVESAVGQGTTFRIYLPRVEKESEAPAAGPEVNEVPAGSGTVLIAEDEKDVRELAREFLSLSGYTVLEAKDGAEAMEIAQSHPGPIHLLIADVVMPRLGGRELAARLAQLRPATKTLFISGYADFTAKRGEDRDQASCMLTKPFTRSELAGMVGRLVGPTPASPGGQQMPPR